MGIDGINGAVVDVNEIGVLDPLAVKMQTIKTAIESACMLLRIDDVVSGMADQSGPKGQPSEEDMEEAATVGVFVLGT